MKMELIVSKYRVTHSMLMHFLTKFIGIFDLFPEVCTFQKYKQHYVLERLLITSTKSNTKKV